LKLKKPNQISIEKLEEIPGGAYILQFDGGTIRKLGVGGYLVWGPDGGLKTAQALWFGEERTTNNECELGALLEALKWVE
jgi:ribonuclease HI